MSVPAILNPLLFTDDPLASLAALALTVEKTSHGNQWGKKVTI